MKALFGPSGVGEEFLQKGGKGLLDVPSFVKEYGLDAFEYSFGHGYQMSSELARKAGALFAENNIKVSLHAPFYINFANPDELMYSKSQSYLYTGIKFLKAFGSDRLIFHAASCGQCDRNEVLSLVKMRFNETFDKMEEEGDIDGLYFCPETMGKSMQIGTYKEIVDLCSVNSHLIPTFDFGHINALTQGGLVNEEDYVKIFDYCQEKLGWERTCNCHIHFSKIQFGNKGEIRHLNFDDTIFGPEFLPLANVLVKKSFTPRIICESKSDMPKDALTMKKIYQNLLDK